MGTMDRSLRALVDKWLGSAPAAPMRVAGFGRMRTSHRRYVCIEASRPPGAFFMYFFLHDDGTWGVFPPNVKRPTMGIS
ncbi:hypothetical protein [Paraburkholderia sp. MM5477-R1]|uniref:hypothetical protein n=1 Tax=Paraburkholderia sp. MM5477-R1 TaxID=2991062 RepID=UPI003D24E073